MHSNGFSPVCVCKWRRKLLRCRKHLPQSLYVHTNGFSPVWIRMWFRYVTNCAKLRPHSSLKPFKKKNQKFISSMTTEYFILIKQVYIMWLTICMEFLLCARAYGVSGSWLQERKERKKHKTKICVIFGRKKRCLFVFYDTLFEFFITTRFSAWEFELFTMRKHMRFMSANLCKRFTALYTLIGTFIRVNSKVESIVDIVNLWKYILCRLESW